jgi:hypothetical protein
MQKALLLHRRTLLWAVIFLALSLTGTAVYAQPPGVLPEEPAEAPAEAEEQAPARQTAEADLPLEGAHKFTQLTELMEEPVKNREGEEIGRISEIVIDKEGQVKYAVLTHGSGK